MILWAERNSYVPVWWNSPSDLQIPILYTILFQSFLRLLSYVFSVYWADTYIQQNLFVPPKFMNHLTLFNKVMHECRPPRLSSKGHVIILVFKSLLLTLTFNWSKHMKFFSHEETFLRQKLLCKYHWKERCRVLTFHLYY